MPPLALGVRDVLGEVGAPEPGAGYGCVDYHSSDIGGPDHCSLDLHLGMKLGFEESSLDEVLHALAVAD